jgi:hypothetical protein
MVFLINSFKETIFTSLLDIDTKDTPIFIDTVTYLSVQDASFDW